MRTLGIRGDEMGADNKFNSSKKKIQQRPWFWPAVYSTLAVMLIGIVVGYYALTSDDKKDSADSSPVAEKTDGDGSTLPISTQTESMKYPMKEELVADTQILQEFYDVTAAKEDQEKALLVFNQTYSTSQGISISVKGEPFEVLASMVSGMT